MQPTILAFRLSDERLHTLRAVASAQGLAIIAVPPSDFSQTLGALCALDARNPLAAPCDFAGEMLVMAGLSDAQSDRLLAALRLCLQPNIALKAVLTPANRRWTAAYLYQELCMEHAALRSGNKRPSSISPAYSRDSPAASSHSLYRSWRTILSPAYESPFFPAGSVHGSFFSPVFGLSCSR